jgi:hypothetical protein
MPASVLASPISPFFSHSPPQPPYHILYPLSFKLGLHSTYRQTLQHHLSADDCNKAGRFCLHRVQRGILVLGVRRDDAEVSPPSRSVADCRSHTVSPSPSKRDNLPISDAKFPCPRPTQYLASHFSCPHFKLSCQSPKPPPLSILMQS